MVLPDSRGRPRRHCDGATVMDSSLSSLTFPAICSELLVHVHRSYAFVLPLVISETENVHLHLSLPCTQRLCALGGLVPCGHFQLANTSGLLAQFIPPTRCILQDCIVLLHSKLRLYYASSP